MAFAIFSFVLFVPFATIAFIFFTISLVILGAAVLSQGRAFEYVRHLNTSAYNEIGRFSFNRKEVVQCLQVRNTGIFEIIGSSFLWCNTIWENNISKAVTSCKHITPKISEAIRQYNCFYTGARKRLGKYKYAQSQGWMSLSSSVRAGSARGRTDLATYLLA